MANCAYLHFVSSYEEAISLEWIEGSKELFCKHYLPLFWIIPIQDQHFKKINVQDEEYAEYLFVIEKNEYLAAITINSIELKSEAIKKLSKEAYEKVEEDLEAWIEYIKNINYSYISINLSEIVGLYDSDNDVSELLALRNKNSFPLKDYILEQLDGFMNPTNLETWSENVKPYLVGYDETIDQVEYKDVENLDTTDNNYENKSFFSKLLNKIGLCCK